MAGETDSEFKSTLSEEVLKKAKSELGEDPNTRLLEIKNLRAKVEKISGLKARTDAAFLLRFLRARKFEQERALKLVKNHYETHKDKDIFEDLKPSQIKQVLDDGLIDVLADRDNEGCTVVVFRPGKWDPEHFPITYMIKSVYLLMSFLLRNEETQVHGIHMIENFDGFGWKQGSNMKPGYAKKFMSILQDALPLRLKRIDICKEPTFFDIIFAMVKPFMKAKLSKRLHLHGFKFDGLHKTMNPDLLPVDFGGKVPMYNYQTWKEEFLASDASFEEEFKFGFLKMEIAKDKQGADAGMGGLAGTFKKLDV